MKNLCVGIQPREDDNEFRKIEKVLAPFMQTFKKRKRAKTDIIPDEHKDLYLKRNPKELIEHLNDLYTEKSLVGSLLNETGELLKSVTNSKCFNLYTTDYERGEITVVSESNLSNPRFQYKLPIETGTYLACYVASKKEYVMATDILGDVRFPLGIPNAGFTVKAAICLPIILNTDNECIGIIELFRDHSKPPYTLVNLEICNALTAWLGIALEQNNTNILLYKELGIQKSISELASMYFSNVLPFDKVISDLLDILKISVEAEKGGFFIFYGTITQGYEEIIYADSYDEGFIDSENTFLLKKKTKMKFAPNAPGIPGYAARTGDVINIRDAYKDSRFNRGTDSPLYRTKSVLCVPVKSPRGVIAVIKLINKQNYPYFRKEDIDLLQKVLPSVALICQYYDLDTSYTREQLKRLEIEKLLDIQSKTSIDDVLTVKAYILSELQLPIGFNRFDWDTSGYEEDAHKYIVLALWSSEIFESVFDIQNLIDFMIRVKKGYHQIAFHNFEHVFNVFHCAFVALHKNKDVFNIIEMVAIILTSVCHDIDHSGLTNNFLYLTNDLLTQLYDDCPGEMHRYEFTLFLLQASNVLVKFSSENYQLITTLLKKQFAGFDMAIFLNNRKKLIELYNSDLFDWENVEHRYLIQNMLLICADSCPCFKNFEIAKKHSTNYYKELHHQGDLEKVLEFDPLPLLDRSKSEAIPEHQIVHMTVIVIPTVELIVRTLPNLEILNISVNETLEKWEEIVTMRGQEMWKMNVALVKEKKDKKGHKLSTSFS
ncbi:cAMP and cAMP-inhibited cGMP 3',5'-cyclic phosphodiesterase, putative [Pediculus humanus corporis]|uniref:Phosphodiesterase n=1 Tax=Pediculus humanus subsp. corporis TaxID=121224 RepID=E0VD88_PEDHC|nr:cAMP and cAMP-inhibited cGMP 3',5'-cyclic phosphodiesterase, putative [Pediculus humanus corporis]EEB11344.1 cAMP and cAMP-inhibited cGMP 3',5'-cyclic phosphodiesterase, putative [Pediculus humanus corporis]